MFLVRHDIRNVVDLVLTTANLLSKKAEVSKEKSKVFKARAKCNSLFKIVDEMRDLKECENSYQLGDPFFEEEHEQWQVLEQKIKSQGYRTDEVEELKEHFRNEIAFVREKERAVFKELNIAKSIMKEFEQNSANRKKEDDINHTKQNRDISKQPIR